MRGRRLFTGLLLACVTCFQPAAGMAGEPGSSACITAQRLKERVYFLASDALEGRYPGSRGYRTAADYAASQFRAAGLAPIVGAPEPRSYFQPVPLVRRTVKGPAVVTVRTPSGEHTFGAESLKIYTTEGLVGEGRPRPVVFAGFGIREPGEGWDDLAGLDVKGKVALILMGAPMEDGEPVLSDRVHRLYAAANSVLWKQAAFRGAAAVIAPADGELAEDFPAMPAFPEGPRFVLDDPKPGSLVNPPLAPVSLEMAETIFGGGGVPDAAAVGKRQVPRGDVEGVTIALRVPMADERVETWNVLGLVAGTDPVLENQVVVVSAHLDHLPPGENGEIHPGANDNASGAAALIEAASVLAAHPPRRSVVFALFAAEEGGQMGARHFLARGPVPRERIVADLNMDMIGRTEEDLLADRAQYALGSERVRPFFTTLIEAVNARTVGWSLRFSHPWNLGTSDHLAFESVGIPAVDFYSGFVPETHQTTDTADRLDYEKAERIARLVCELAIELANRDPLWG